MRRIVAIADDLSGAAETAIALAPPAAPHTRHAPHGSMVPRIVLLSGDAPSRRADAIPDQLLILDTDSRRFSAEYSTRRLGVLLQNLLGSVGSDARPLVFLKVDSLLRGHLADSLGALSAHGPIVFAPALPALARSTIGGVVHAAGTPLHQTTLWHAEPTAVPATIAASLAPLDVALVDLHTVRGAHSILAARLRELATAGVIAVCDAETADDLDALAAAALRQVGTHLVGASAFAAAVGRAVRGTPQHQPTAQPAPSPNPPDPAFFPWGSRDDDAPGNRASGSVLVVVGTASSQSREQLRTLAAAGVTVVTLHPADLLNKTANPAALSSALALGSAAVCVDRQSLDPAVSGRLADAFAAFVAPLTHGHHLVLTGGETARAVLQSLGVLWMEPVHEIEHGAVLSRTDQGGLVVTRPGSFGGPDSLHVIYSHLRSLSATPPFVTATASAAVRPTLTRSFMNTVDLLELPYVAVTMGDGAGVGPEIVVAAVLAPQSNAQCRPVVIGDALRLRQAATILGVDARIVAIEQVQDAVFEPGRVNVIDLALLPEDLPWGQLSRIAGHAAYEYIKKAAELAMSGQVQAICTAPLNKEALHSAGHIFPGHTEMLATLTGIDEVSMMLSTPTIKVIHVTTHIGLVDAVAKINPGLVERTIRRGHDALVRAGVARPKIGVCAINPHAGEGGLFGQGEEAEKIEPGVRAAREAGVDVYGPLPADTLFFLAGRGDYDLVVAMYHDQGHGPVKVLGIEAGVNITVGLPVIRTSVDHGTAFDIAGKAIADSRSMIEALHQAAEMATRTAVG